VTVNGNSLQFPFLLADVRFPILGIDFLRHYELVVDVCAERLLPRTALAQPVGGNVFAVQQQACKPAAGISEWDSILAEYPGVSQPFSVVTKPAHGMEHVIETSERPTRAKFRRRDPVRLAAAKQEFQKMLNAGVVRRSSSCWSSPLHMVKKKSGGWRPCRDFRHLNAATAEDKYPLPNMGDLSARLDSCKIFSKLDLQKGYYQVPVAATDAHKTAVITPFGLFEFTHIMYSISTICWWPAAVLRSTAVTYGRLSIGSRRMGWSSIGKSVCSGCLK
jgi:hypothetical protein